MTQNNNEKYTKFGYGVFVLKSKNSLFNADFSHEPRQLPDEDGTFYATDKSLKYCIRRYVHDIKGEKEVFFWRRGKPDGKPMDINGNFVSLFGAMNKTKRKAKKEGGKEKEDVDVKDLETKLLSCWDVRVFGATYAGDAAVSLTGPVQITYGINKTQENQKYSSQILSPFGNLKKEDAAQETIGSESKNLEMHLAFDYIINPKTLAERNLTMVDVGLFKEALCKGVSYVNSAAKIGSESEFMLYLESDTLSTLPLLKDLLDVRIDNGKTKINLVKISDLAKRYGISHVEIYYEPACVEVSGTPQGVKEFNIHTQKPL